MSELKYKKFLLKISGEALLGSQQFGIDPEPVHNICNEIKNSVILNRINVLHDALIFDRWDNEGYAILRIPKLVDYQYWAGLSGAPILDDEGLLAGMLVRGPEREPFITAIPIEKIIWFLDIIIKNEDCTPFKL